MPLQADAGLAEGSEVRGVVLQVLEGSCVYATACWEIHHRPANSEGSIKSMCIQYTSNRAGSEVICLNHKVITVMIPRS